MIDPETEQMLTMTEAAKTAPARPDISTVWRWRSRGIRGIKLETLLCGGRRMTSREALDRFFAAVTAAADGETSTCETPLQRERAIDAAERAASELGGVSDAYLPHPPRRRIVTADAGGRAGGPRRGHPTPRLARADHAAQR